ncbi:MAG TPA: hypothetical protein VKA32_04715 [Gammaproteobacteria bacterium]|nr:hypothetical protein [Gammaproteobacteria bacterium]
MKWKVLATGLLLALVTACAGPMSNGHGTTNDSGGYEMPSGGGGY